MYDTHFTKAEEISIEADITDAVNMLISLGKNEKSTMRKVLGAVGTDAKNKARKAYRKIGLEKHSGELYKSIIRKVLKNGKEVLISAKARNARNIFYGYALAKGSEIRARNSDYLRFEIDGKWRSVKEVKLKEHDFIVSPVKDYLASTAFKERLAKVVQKEIDRIEKEKMKNENRNAGS